MFIETVVRKSKHQFPNNGNYQLYGGKIYEKNKVVFICWYSRFPHEKHFFFCFNVIFSEICILVWITPYIIIIKPFFCCFLRTNIFMIMPTNNQLAKLNKDFFFVIPSTFVCAHTLWHLHFVCIDQFEIVI